MKIIVSTFYYPNYKELAEKTVWKNLKDYCFRHGYEFMPFAIEATPAGTPYEVACQACRLNTQLILKTLLERPDCDYFFHRDCDSIITYMGLKLEGLAKFYHEYDIITGSDKAGISMGQVLVKNTERSRSYLASILAGIDSGQYEHEQKYMWDNPAEFLKMAPQDWLNAYDTEARLEKFDPYVSWKPGNFLVHLAGLNLEQKMSRLNYWMEKVK